MKFSLKYFIVLILLSGFQMLTGQSLLDEEVEFNVKNIPIAQALLELSEQTGIPISFDSSIFPENKRVSLNTKKSIQEIIAECLIQYNVEYKVVDESIILKAKRLEQFTVSGYVEDEESGERLIGAYIIDERSGKGATTNEYGFFSLTILEGDININASYIGYQIWEKKINFKKDESLVIKIKQENSLSEIVVKAKPIYFKKINRTQSPLNKMYLSKREQSSASSLIGENDLLQHCYLLPGVETGADGLGGMHVRGGEVDQNLILMDGVPIFNPSHSLGLISIFNSTAVKHVTLEKGGYSAKHGGHLSSVLDVRTNEGNVNKFAGGFEIGTIAGRLTLEGPLKKGNAGFFVSARRSFVDPILNFAFSLAGDGTENSGNYYFYDVNSKVHWKVGEKNKFYLSSYIGGDSYNTESTTSYRIDTVAIIQNDSINIIPTTTIVEENESRLIKWGNFNIAFRWNKEFNKKMFSNLTITGSKFNYKSNFSDQNYYSYQAEDYTENYNNYFYRFNTVVNEIAFKYDVDYIHTPQHTFKFGGGIKNRFFNPGLIYAEDKVGTAVDSILNVINSTSETSFLMGSETLVYGEDRIKIGRWDMTVGLHLSHFIVLQKNYFSAQPRININYKLHEKLNVNTSATKMTQYIHLLSTFGGGFPNDMWFPSTNRTKPQHAWQFTFGLDYQISDHILIGSEIYYKRMKNLIYYRSGASFPQLTDIKIEGWEDELVKGYGVSYGWETRLEIALKRVKFTSNYTWSNSRRYFDEINNGDPFSFSYDRRHSFKSTFSLRIRKRVDLTSSYIYATGRPITLVKTEGIPLLVNNSNGEVEQISSINGHRLKDYSRWNIGLDFNYDTRWGGHVFSFGIYNVLAERNVIFEYIKDDPGTGETRLEQTTLLPFLPSLKYKIFIK